MNSRTYVRCGKDLNVTVDEAKGVFFIFSDYVDLRQKYRVSQISAVCCYFLGKESRPNP